MISNKKPEVFQKHPLHVYQKRFFGVKKERKRNEFNMLWYNFFNEKKQIKLHTLKCRSFVNRRTHSRGKTRQ